MVTIMRKHAFFSLLLLTLAVTRAFGAVVEADLFAEGQELDQSITRRGSHESVCNLSVTNLLRAHNVAVSGSEIICGDLRVKGNGRIDGDLTLGGRLITDSTNDSVSQAICDEGGVIPCGLTINGDTTIEGNTTINGDTTINGGVTYQCSLPGGTRTLSPIGTECESCLGEIRGTVQLATTPAAVTLLNLVLLSINLRLPLIGLPSTPVVSTGLPGAGTAAGACYTVAAVIDSETDLPDLNAIRINFNTPFAGTPTVVATAQTTTLLELINPGIPVLNVNTPLAGFVEIREVAPDHVILRNLIPGVSVINIPLVTSLVGLPNLIDFRVIGPVV